MIPLLAFVALCIDIGWATITKSMLQNAADAAATAGARQLVDHIGAFHIPAQPHRAALVSKAEAAAATYCQTFCGYNAAGGVSSLSLLPEDTVFGFTDASGNFISASTYPGYPNTVQATVRRDASANGKLPFFFASAFGTNDTSLTATASATIYSGLITAFGPVNQVSGGAGGVGSGIGAVSSSDGWSQGYWANSSSFRCSLLPVAFDVNDWNAFINSGASPGGEHCLELSGAPCIHIYPTPQETPGSFGLLCVGPWTETESIYANWIVNGPCVTDLEYLSNSSVYPVSLNTPMPWKGSPGIPTPLVSSFSMIIGQPRLLPLFQAVSQAPYQAASGFGTNTTYNVVGFVGVMVTSVSNAEQNFAIYVQPCSVLDPSAVMDPATIGPAGTEPPGRLAAYTVLPPKLSR